MMLSCVLLRSMYPITSLLRPRVFAASLSLRCVPLRMPRCSTRLPNTSLPWAMKASSWASVCWMNECSRSACDSRAEIRRLRQTWLLRLRSSCRRRVDPPVAKRGALRACRLNGDSAIALTRRLACDPP